MNNNGFTLVELLAVIVVLSIVMIIAIPNILSTMSTSKKEALKIYAEKTLSEAQKQYETEKLSGITPGEETSGSKFTERGDYGLVIKISDLFPNQNKYIGCVLIDLTQYDYEQGDWTEQPIYYIYIYDGEYKLQAVSQRSLSTASAENDDLKPSSDNAVLAAKNINNEDIVFTPRDGIK